MIVASELCKTFDPEGAGALAVDHVNFEAHPGRVFALLGPNGSGKTTTLRMLSTILKPTSGTAVVNGHDIHRQPMAVRRSIGFLTGGTGVYDRMTAREMVAYFGSLYGLGAQALKARIDELFTMLDMHSFADTLCARLSTGMKQKVSIARTLVHDPPVLIFDEPTSGLDILIQRVLMDFVRSQRAAGKTVLFSTHIMDEAEKVCDDVAFIYKGKILQQGEVGAIKQAHGGRSIEDIFFDMIGKEKVELA